MIHVFRTAVAALDLSTSPALMVQSAYPAKPIRVIIPMPVGTGIDVILRKAAGVRVEKYNIPRQ